jgi:formylglycine-generating enzyme required for sulfatase activity
MHLIRIPAGEFRMGSDPAQDGKAESFEFPQHTLFVEDFWIDQTEVSNAQYARCVAAKKCAAPQKISSYKRSAYYNAPAYANYPVIWVSWEDARAYCAWVGRRLPGEAEWEKAARGPDGRIYPWGSQPPDCDLANFGGGPAYCVGDTAEVGSYPAGASLYGVLDMAGNVTEWVADWFSARYYAESPANNPEGPQSGLDKVMRGGDWASNPVLLRGAFRSSGLPSRKSNALGFRCAQTASK